MTYSPRIPKLQKAFIISSWRKISYLKIEHLNPLKVGNLTKQNFCKNPCSTLMFALDAAENKFELSNKCR